MFLCFRQEAMDGHFGIGGDTRDSSHSILHFMRAGPVILVQILTVSWRAEVAGRRRATGSRRPDRARADRK